MHVEGSICRSRPFGLEEKQSVCIKILKWTQFTSCYDVQVVGKNEIQEASSESERRGQKQKGVEIFRPLFVNYEKCN